jgi:hypothetical protein
VCHMRDANGGLLRPRARSCAYVVQYDVLAPAREVFIKSLIVSHLVFPRAVITRRRRAEAAVVTPLMGNANEQGAREVELRGTSGICSRVEADSARQHGQAAT